MSLYSSGMLRALVISLQEEQCHLTFPLLYSTLMSGKLLPQEGQKNGLSVVKLDLVFQLPGLLVQS